MLIEIPSAGLARRCAVGAGWVKEIRFPLELCLTIRSPEGANLLTDLRIDFFRFFLYYIFIMKTNIFRSIIVFLGALILTLSFVNPLHGIIVCHDYSYYRVTGNDPCPLNGPGKSISPAKLREYLGNHGYKRFPYTNAAKMPGAGERLKSGDVIILDNAHSGYVTGSNRIDHFIQVFGASGTKYSAQNLPQAPIPGKVGGLYTGDSLKGFINRRFKKTYRSIEIWRKR
jgi:hypothetical protein